MTDKIANPTVAGIAIAEALGLNPNRIKKGGITIRLEPHECPQVDVTYFIYEKELHGIAELLKQYRLVPLAEAQP